MGLIDRWDTADGFSAPPYCYNIAIFHVAFLLQYILEVTRYHKVFGLLETLQKRPQRHHTATLRHSLSRQLFDPVFTICDQIS